MNYKNIYTNAFLNKDYSKEHHSQYDWTLDLLKKNS